MKTKLILPTLLIAFNLVLATMGHAQNSLSQRTLVDASPAGYEYAGANFFDRDSIFWILLPVGDQIPNNSAAIRFTSDSTALFKRRFGHSPDTLLETMLLGSETYWIRTQWNHNETKVNVTIQDEIKRFKVVEISGRQIGVRRRSRSR